MATIKASELFPVAVDLFAAKLVRESRWYTLGILLGVPSDVLDPIERDYKSEGVMRCYIEMHKYFSLMMKPLSWEKIAKCLVDMRNRDLACQIEEQLMHEQHCSSASDCESNDLKSKSPQESSNHASETLRNSPPREFNNTDVEVVIEVPQVVKHDFLNMARLSSALVTEIKSEFRGSDVSVQELHDFVCEYCELSPFYMEYTTIEDVFECLRTHEFYNLLDFNVFKALVETFFTREEPLFNSVATYTEEIDRFENSKPIKELIDLIVEQNKADKHPIVKLNVRESWSEAMLYKFGKVMNRMVNSLCICVAIGKMALKRTRTELSLSDGYGPEIAIHGIKDSSGTVGTVKYARQQ